MIAFLGQVEVKEKYIARVRAHREADQLVKGVYWERGKGCAVGCTVHSGNHAAYEKDLGIPRLLAKLEDGIFEGLPSKRAMVWPEQFLSAIAVGADLSGVWPQFAVWLLVDPQCGVVQFARSERAKKAIRDVADAYQLVIQKSSKSPDWASLRADAAAAAYDAADADAADAAYAAYAAYAAGAAAYAAYAAASAAYAAAAARHKMREDQADKLLELLAAAASAE